jgi:hypothetical protein
MDAGLAVLDHHTGRGIDAHLPGSVQEQVRCGLATGDLGGAVDAACEAFVEAGAAQGVPHLVMGAAGGHAHRQGERVECFRQALDGGEPGIHGLTVELLEPVRPDRGRRVRNVRR